MRRRFTPCLPLMLLPALALAAGAPDGAAQKPKVTQLATVEVKAKPVAASDGAQLAAYGEATPHATPAAIRTLDRAQLDDVHALRDLVHADAALGDGYAPVGYIQNLTIRGYPLDLATGYRINDLTVTGEQYVALEDVQQVQILKGLAGLDAGIAEPGGTVNFVTKRPADVRTLTLGTDSHGSREGALDVGGWLTPNFGLRANVGLARTHSYVRHAPGRHAVYALAADWRIGARALLQLDTNYEDDSQRSASAYQLLGGTAIPSHASATRLLGFEPWQRPTGVRAENSSARFSYALADAWRLLVAGGHSRSVVDDNVAFAYGCSYAPACTGPGTGVYFAPNGDYDVWDFRSPGETYVDDEARATLAGQLATGAVRHDLTFGASAFHHTVALPGAVFDYVGTANIADRDPPYFPPSPAEPTPAIPRLDSWQRTLFALDRAHFGDAWQIIAGARFVRLDERAWDADGGLERTTRRTSALPQAALLWLPTAALTAYASYSEGLALGKEAPYWATNAGDTLAPRRSRQFETGLKFRARDGLDLELAAYRIAEPYQFAEPADGGFTFVQRGEEVHAGIEVSADGALSANLGIHASVALIRARAQATGNPAYENHQVANVPRARADVYLDYALPALPRLSVIGGWRYAAPNAATADGRVRVPAWNAFDAGLRYRAHWNGHALTWRLTIDNVFNHFYWAFTGSDGNDSYLLPGAPRLARLTLEVAL